MEDYWVTIPAGEFQMGSSDKEIADAKEYVQIVIFRMNSLSILFIWMNIKLGSMKSPTASIPSV